MKTQGKPASKPSPATASKPAKAPPPRTSPAKIETKAGRRAGSPVEQDMAGNQSEAEPRNDGPAPEDGRTADQPVPRTFTKTPMFEATHAARYQRQRLIKDIDADTGTSLLCYVSGDKREIERDDTLGLMDLLHNIPSGANIDLLLHTAGGDVDAADKFLQIVLARIGETGGLRVVVPDYAKSAGTLIALGAHRLIMSDSSELGTIDPQFVLHDQHGNPICTSVTAYLDAFRDYSDQLRKDPEDPVAAAMLNQFDSFVVRKFQGYSNRARHIAERLLRRKTPNWTKIASDLLTESKWKSHGERIGYEDAQQALELDVVYMPPTDALWQQYWQLYCLQRLEVGKDKKIFESAWVSQIFER